MSCFCPEADGGSPDLYTPNISRIGHNRQIPRARGASSNYFKAVSNVEDSPRGLDFVFNLNRLNAAVSRAQALTIIVANQNLEQCSVHSL